ncbi:MAG: formylglycine-generating enzyme family protein [Planctomycetaceae bacterium]|nr:formylglycine-generating enzyme family protein [Planctomycetaceae bacterium]
MPPIFRMMMAFPPTAFAQKYIGLTIVLLFVGGCGSTDSGPKTLETVTNSIGMPFLVVPPGKFRMGSNSGSANERPIHEVTISQPFGLGVTEVTQQQYTTVMGKNPNFTSPANAINSLSWNQANEFCQRLSMLPEEKAAGRIYRLPTEAEWEYACRAGTDTAYSFGDDPTQVTTNAWYNRNSGQDTHPPSQKPPNPWGFSDMHGNAWEWCQNWLYDYPDTPETDPTGPATGKLHVLRGGGWFHREPDCRSASRFTEDPNSPTKFTGGLRVAYTSR